MAGKQTRKSEAGREGLVYQLDILKMELEGLERIVARQDEMAQTAKNWTITIWTGSLAIALSQPDYRKFILITAIAPILFWYIDSYIRHLQRRSIYRGQKISKFLNSPKLAESFEKNTLTGITVYDPTAAQYRGLDEYRKFVSRRKTFLFPEVASFYSVLTAVSIVMGLFFLFVLQ